MTLQELRYIIALADSGQFVRAAQVCHVGQPTLSTQLKKLEDYLGVTLFERNNHRLVPTPVGEKIIEQARMALDIVERIRQLARQGREPMGGPLRLGVIPTVGPYLMPHLLPAIRGTFPELHLFLREDLTANLLERLRQCRLDALLLALPVRGDDLETLALFHERFMVALPEGNPLTRKSSVTAADLDEQTVMLLEEGHCMRDQALEICGSNPSSERDELKATSLETLRQMVAAGVGCTLLPALAAFPGVGSVDTRLVHVRPFAEPEAFRSIGIVWRRRYPREQTLHTLANVILANLPAAVEPVRPPYSPRTLAADATLTAA